MILLLHCTGNGVLLVTDKDCDRYSGKEKKKKKTYVRRTFERDADSGVCFIANIIPRRNDYISTEMIVSDSKSTTQHRTNRVTEFSRSVRNSVSQERFRFGGCPCQLFRRAIRSMLSVDNFIAKHCSHSLDFRSRDLRLRERNIDIEDPPSPRSSSCPPSLSIASSCALLPPLLLERGDYRAT